MIHDIKRVHLSQGSLQSCQYEIKQRAYRQEGHISKRTDMPFHDHTVELIALNYKATEQTCQTYVSGSLERVLPKAHYILKDMFYLVGRDTSLMCTRD